MAFGRHFARVRAIKRIPVNLHLPTMLCVRVIACVLSGLLVSCSGAVSGPPAAPLPLSVTPSAATLFSDLPTTFVLSGGAAPYFVASSDQATVPVFGPVSGTSFTVVPAQVATETSVNLTISDSAGTTPVTAALTVRPRIVSNVVTITPNSTGCGTSICPGGDAEVSVVLMQNGVPLAGRQVRFTVTSGQALVVTGSTEGASGTTVSDASGTARIRVRVPSGATEQMALLEITDVTSGSRLLTSLAISIANAPLNAQPSALNFVGSTSTTCASDAVSATVIIFGGRPPYVVSQPANFLVQDRLLNSSPGSFTVRAKGVCVAAETISVVDSNGSTVNVTASNAAGSVPPSTPLQATPGVVTLDTCTSQATIALAGGTPGSYMSNEQSGSVMVTKISTNQFTLKRTPGSGAALSPIQVGFTDGQSVTEVTVNLGPVAQGACPAP